MPWASRDVLREQFTLEDLNYHDLKYRHHIEGQNYLNTDDNAKLRLIKALGRLPQINSVEFASGEVEPEEEIMDRKPWSFLTAIGRETLSEPCSNGDSNITPSSSLHSCKPLLRAAKFNHNQRGRSRVGNI